MASYPSSLKSYTNPNSNTRMDDSGFELDVVVSSIQDEVVAIETELGTTPKAPTLATPAPSSSSVSNLLGMILQRFKDITNLTNWYDSFTSIPITKGGTGSVTAGAARTALGLAIGTDVQAYSSDIATKTGTETLTNKTLTSPVITNKSSTGTDSGTETLTNKTLITPVINTSFSGTAIASGAEVTTGTDNTKAVTPKAMGDAGVNTRLASKTKTATRDLSASSGDVQYTGVGFTPTAIIAIASVDGNKYMSWGVVDSARSSASSEDHGDGTHYYTTNLIFINVSAAVTQEAVVKSYDADGFTLTWTKSGSPTGIANLIFLCFK